MPTNKLLLAVISYVICIFSLQAQIPDGYYDNAEGKSGDDLKSALNDIISGHTVYPYTSSSTDTWDILKQADRDPNNSANVLGIYSAFSMNAEAEFDGGDGWTREHVWPRSRGDFDTGDTEGTDCHHLRAEDASTNSARGNRNFDECDSPYTDGSGTHSGATPSFSCDDGYIWKPRPDVIGDIARSLFYMATRYEGENGDLDLELTEDLQAQGSNAPLHAKLSTLLQWHVEDPVSDAERARNDIIYGFQGNRNPFIDRPEFVDRIWGSAAVPEITVNESLTDFGEVDFGMSSATQMYSVSGSSLSGALNIESTADFQVSLTDNSNDFSTSLSITPDEGSIASTNIFVRFTPASDANGIVNGSITHSSTGATDQTISVSGTETEGLPTEIILEEDLASFGTVEFGMVSTTQMYSVSATSLTEVLTIESTSDFEISFTDNANEFTSMLSITPDEGNVASTNIFVRFVPSSDANGIVTGTITHSSAGATDQTITVSGTELDDNPVQIILDEDLSDFGVVEFGMASATQMYSLTAVGLTGSLTIESTSDFEISFTDNSNEFTSMLSITPENGNVASTNLFVRFVPSSNSNGPVNGSITHSSTGAADRIISVSGFELDDNPPEINFSFTSRTIDVTEEFEVGLFANQVSTQNINIQIDIVASSGLTYSTNYTTVPAAEDNRLTLSLPANELNTDFNIDLIPDQIDVSSESSVTFSLDSSPFYAVGPNDTFELILKSEVVIAGQQNDLKGQLNVYPNPADDNVTIDWENGNFRYSITDLTGRTLITGESLRMEKIDISNLKSGQYFLTIFKLNQWFSQKLLVY